MTPDGETAFNQLKTMLCSAPVLRSVDFNKPFFVQCDAYKTGVGGVLVQEYLGTTNIQSLSCQKTKQGTTQLFSH